MSDEAGVDDVLLHPVPQTTKLRSNVDVSKILVRIETSFHKPTVVDNEEVLSVLLALMRAMTYRDSS